MADRMSFSMNLVSGVDQLAKVMQTLNSIMKGSDVHEYLKDSKILIDQMTAAYERFNRENNATSASELVKVANALEAMGVNLKDNVKDFDNISAAIERAKAAARDVNIGFSPDVFKNANEAFNLMRSSGLDIEEILKRITASSDVRDLQSQIDGLNNKLAMGNTKLDNARRYIDELRAEIDSLSNGTGIDTLNQKIEDLSTRLSDLIRESKQEFASFLDSNDIDPDTMLAYGLFQRIEDGLITSKQAIKSFKEDYANLLSSGGQGPIDIESISGLSEKLSEISAAIENISGGVAGDGSLDGLKEFISTLFESCNINGSSGITDVINSIKEFVLLGESELGAAKDLIRSIMSMSGLTIDTAPITNLTNFINSIAQAQGNLSNLSIVSNTNLSGFSNLKVSQASLRNLSTYLPDISKNTDVTALQNLSNIDWTKLSNLSVRKPSIENIKTLLDELSDGGRTTTQATNVLNAVANIASNISSIGVSVDALAQNPNLANVVKAFSDLASYANAAQQSAGKIAVPNATNAGYASPNIGGQQGNAKSKKKLYANLSMDITHVFQIYRQLDQEIAKGNIIIDASTGKFSSQNKEFQKLVDAGNSLITTYNGLTNQTLINNSKLNKSQKAILSKRVAIKKEQEDIDKQKYSRGVTDKNQANEYNTGIDLIQKTIALRKELLQLEAEGQVKVGTGANGAPAWEYIGNGQAGSHIQELLKQANKLPVTEQQLTAAINNASVSENQRLKLLKKEHDLLDSIALKETHRADTESNRTKAEEEADNYKDLISTVDRYYKSLDKIRNISLRSDSVIRHDDNINFDSVTGTNRSFVESVNQYKALQDEFIKTGFDDILSDDLATQIKNIENHKKNAKVEADKLNISEEQYLELLNRIVNKTKESSKTFENNRNSAKDAWDKNTSKAINLLQSNEVAIKSDSKVAEIAKDIQDLINSNAPENIEKLKQKMAELTSTVYGNDSNNPSFFRKLYDTFGNQLRNLMSHAITASVTKYLRSIYKNVLDINTAMTKLRIVTNDSEAAYKRFSETAVESARKIGASISEIIDSTTTYAKLGFSFADSAKFAEVTSAYSKISDVSVDETTRNLTGIIKAYDIGADNIEKVVDKLVYVGNNYAISQAEIGEGMNNAASSLKTNNNSINQAIALLTAANSTVQDISRASTALRTITARLSASKADLESIGEDSDGVESVSKLANDFEAFGINITDGNGKLLSTYDIISRIAAKWDDFDTEQRNTIAGLAAGTRQQDIFYSLINNFSDASQILKDIDSSSGELSTATEKRLDSIQGKLDLIGSRMESLSAELLNSDVAKNILSVVETIIKAFSRFVKSADGLWFSMTTGGIASLALAAALIDIKKSGVGLFFVNLKNKIKEMTLSQWNATVSSKGLNAALTTLGLNPFMVWVTVITVALTALVKIIDMCTTSLKEQEELLSDSKSKYADLTSEVESLNNELEKTAERLRELNKIENPSFADKEEIDLLTQRNSELERELYYKKQLQKVANKDLNKNFVKTLVKDVQTGTEYKDYGVPGDREIYRTGSWSSNWRTLALGLSFNDALMSYVSEQEYIETMFDDYARLQRELQDASSEKEYKKITEQIESIEEYLSSKSQKFDEYKKDIVYIDDPTTDDEKAVNEWLDYINDFQGKMMIALGGNDAKRMSFERVTDNWKFSELTSGLKKLGEEGKVTAELLSDPKYAEFIDKLIELGVVGAGDYDSIALAFNKITSSIQESARVITEVTKKTPAAILSEVQDGYDGLSSALSDVSEKGKITASTLSKLYELENNGKLGTLKLSEIIEQTKDGFIIQEDALQTYVESMYKAYASIDAFATEKDKNNALENLKRLHGVFITLAETNENAAKSAKDILKEQKEAIEKQVDKYNELVNIRKKLLESYQKESEYQDELVKKQKKVSTLQQQLAVAQLDSSASGQAKVRSLTEELANAQEELDDFTLEHAIDMIVNEMDDQYEEYKKLMDSEMDRIEDAINKKEFVDYQKLADVLSNGITEIQEKGTRESYIDYVQKYVNDNNMLESDRNRWGQNKTFLSLWNELTSEEKKLIKGVVPTHHSGGFVGDTNRLKSSEEFAKLLKGEFVSTPAQMKRFMNTTLPAIASGVNTGSNEFNAPLIQIQCDSVTSESLPNLKNVVNEAVMEIKRELDSGFDRTGFKRRARAF